MPPIAAFAAAALTMPLPPGFVVGWQQTAQTGTIEERVPQGETVDNWSRMITLLKLAIPLPPARYAELFDAQITRACPGATLAGPTPATIGAHPAVAARLDCPLNPETGKPETMFYRVAAGDSGLVMAQIAFRHVPSAEEARWATAQLDAARLCGGAAPDKGC